MQWLASQRWCLSLVFMHSPGLSFRKPHLVNQGQAVSARCITYGKWQNINDFPFIAAHVQESVRRLLHLRAPGDMQARLPPNQRYSSSSSSSSSSAIINILWTIEDSEMTLPFRQETCQGFETCCQQHVWLVTAQKVAPKQALMGRGRRQTSLSCASATAADLTHRCTLNFCSTLDT